MSWTTGYISLLLVFLASLFVSVGPRSSGHCKEEEDLGSKKAERLEGGERGDREAHVRGVHRESREDSCVHIEERERPSEPQVQGVQEPSAAGVVECVHVTQHVIDM